MSSVKYWCTLAFVLSMSFALLSVAEAVPMPSRLSYNNGPGYYNMDMEEPTEEMLMDLIARLGRSVLRARDDLENEKRTVDFGLARGYSGLQEAKHRMGIAAANYAGGPGRKRRSSNNSEA